jgi:hypothetical protein
MLKDFPLTSVPFTPVRELEKRNQAHLKKVQDALQLADSLSRVVVIEP